MMSRFDSITLQESARHYRIRGGIWEYTLSRASGLIEQASVRGQPWLARPVPDLWASGAVDPRPDEYSARHAPDAQARLVSASPECVLIESEGRFARVDGALLPLRWQLRYRFDEDGTVQVDVTVGALENTAIRWLSLGRGMVRRSACRFITHETDNGEGWATCRPASHDLAEGDYEAGGRFIPWLHFGSDRGGLDIVFPHSDRSFWGWTDTCPYPTGDPLGRPGDRMRLGASQESAHWEAFAFRNLYEPLPEGWSYFDTFYLSLLPGKEMPPSANDLRVWWMGPHQYVSGWRHPDESKIAEWSAAGANLVIGRANWRSGDYSHPDHPDEAARFIETCHRYGMKVIPYITFTDMEFGAPAFDRSGREWRIEPVAEFNYRSHLMCYGAEGWQAHWEKEVVAFWKALPFDGLCIDFWAGRMVCRNDRHGCAGPHGRFNAAGLRRMARFAHRLVSERNGLIVANCNIMPIAMLNNYFDVRLLGEWHNLEETESLTTRLFHNAHRYGSGNLLLVGNIPRLTEKTLALTEAYQGPQVMSHARTPEERDLLSRRARLLASFGIDRTEALNVFEIPPLPGAEGVQPSLYRRPDSGETLLTLSRPVPGDAAVSLSALSGFFQPAGEASLIFCPETGQLIGGRALGPGEIGKMTLDIPGESLRTLWVRPDPDHPCLLCTLSGNLRPDAQWDEAQKQLAFIVEHPALRQAEIAVSDTPAAIYAGEEAVTIQSSGGAAIACVPCNRRVIVQY
ncbi:MAG: hypothetical protein IT210_14680 [Armatimonadetes bacterium]|nr:hypothetical protein [Armatimonadota bacterium]